MRTAIIFNFYSETVKFHKSGQQTILADPNDKNIIDVFKSNLRLKIKNTQKGYFDRFDMYYSRTYMEVHMFFFTEFTFKVFRLKANQHKFTMCKGRL